MTLLLDTHAFLWFCQDDPLLSAAAKALIEDPGNRKLLSVAGRVIGALHGSLVRLTKSRRRTRNRLRPLRLRAPRIR